VHGSSEPQFLSLQSLYISLSSNSYKMPSKQQGSVRTLQCVDVSKTGTGTSRPLFRPYVSPPPKLSSRFTHLLDSDSEEEEPAPISRPSPDGSSSEFGQNEVPI